MINMLICFAIAMLIQVISILVFRDDKNFTSFKLWGSTVLLFVSMIISFLGVYYLIIDLM